MRNFDEWEIRPETYRKYIFVFCDGACIGNGRPGARAGYGVVFADPKLRHCIEAERLHDGPQTNSRAEILALIRSAKLAPDDGRQVVIFSDSQYAMNCVVRWLDRWRCNGWRNTKGGIVANQDLIEKLAEALDEHRVRPVLQYIKGHSGHQWNDMADAYAKAACRYDS
ncbi:hypothetical protein EX895_004669 [Sporisorium graminicola]|uniref:ribonuclease H n=1 Tax=Sporisorium graminicola TaxID=280036 RepID=A0A4U7KQ84_9BASI|nr:hypothetical protein EX895_004669 [Sporisorium graminicola]TKY86520.1 hypothetical protein EX895_004669 [Sporisorium graminicola]